MKLVQIPASYSKDIRQLQDVELIKDLQTHLVRTGYLADKSEIDGVVGAKTIDAFNDFKKSESLAYPFILGHTTAAKLLVRGESPKLLVSQTEFERVFRYASKKNKDKYFQPLNQACVEFQINTPKRLAAFFAQLAHESGSLKYSEEIASGAAYEGRRDLGNISSGDGVRFKGRGLIQLTGRFNYRKYGNLLGLDLIGNPEQAATPSVSCRIAGLFWKSHGLNELADKGDFSEITRRINGGYNGLRDRIDHWNHAKAVLL
jgi:putative chitinase